MSNGIIIAKQPLTLVFLDLNASMIENEDITVARQKNSKYGYSTNSLLAWYDGENNTYNGHDNNALFWMDLSGNGYNAELRTTVPDGGWIDKGYKFYGRNEFFVIPTLNVRVLEPHKTPISVEIVTKRSLNSRTEYNTVLCTTGDEFSIYRSNNNNNNITLKGPSNRPAINSYRSGCATVTFNPDDGSAILYTDDMNQFDKKVSFWNESISNNPMTIGGSDNSHWYSGNVYAVRFYKRLLSIEEIKRHHAIDKVRFMLDD